MKEGACVAGRFTIERHVGAGGMGSVYYAHDARTGRPVALKVLPDGDMSPTDVARFDREAALLSEISHPGIVGYVAHGVDDAGAPYLAMDWIEGETLGERLFYPIERGEALTLIAAIAHALGAAHARGIVHRDVKPSNIVLEGCDLARPKLVDFGIARHEDGDRALTQTGAILGTPGYMAPEQARGATGIDARADVYSLGCLLFRCLAGRTPFTGPQPVAVLARTIIEDAPRLRDVCEDVTADLDILLARLLSRDPASRLADGTAVANAIAAIMSDPMTEALPPSIVLGQEIVTTGERRFVTVLLGAAAAAGEEPIELSSVGDIAREHAARFEKLADGSFLLIFTTASAPTDLAARACHAALALRALSPSATLSIVSGRALVENSLPIGELLDRAAGVLRRGESAAIALDEGTSLLVRDRFALTTEAGVIRLQRRMGDVSQIGTTLLGKPTACVGRERELAFLEGLFQESAEENVARVALVVAPPGIGKSRLARELVRRIETRAPSSLRLVATSNPLGTSTPLGMLGELLRRAAGCFDAGSQEQERDRLAHWLSRRFHRTGEGRPPLDVSSLLAISGVETTSHVVRTESARDTMLAAWLSWLGSELDERPVLIVLDDLHWGDEPTVAFVDASLRAFATRRLVVIALGRPEMKTLFPRLWVEREPQELRLGPLTRAASVALVRSVLPQPDDRTLTLLVDRAAGNAFFLEELVRTVGQRGAEGLPDTVLAVIQARLDALGPELTRVLRAASIFGTTFWQEGLARLLGIGEESRRLGMWLTSLVDRELVERHAESAIAGCEQLAFRHALVRDGAYAMLTDTDRTRGHFTAAEWLACHGVPDASVLAEHYHRAGESAEAIRWICVDAERAVAAYDASAIRRAERGIALGAAGTELGRLFLAQALALERAVDPRAAEVAEKAQRLFRRASVDWYRSLRVRISCYATRGRSHEDLEPVVAELAEATPDEAELSTVVEYVVAVAEAIFLAGRTDKPAVIPSLVGALFPYFSRSESLPARAGSRLESVASMGYALANEPELALHAARRAVELKRAAGEVDPATELTLVQRLGFLGDMDDLATTLARIEAEVERLGLGLMVTVTRYARVYSLLFLGQYAAAFELGEELRASETLAMDPGLASRLDVLVAKAALRSGRTEDGQRVLAAAVLRTSDVSPVRCRVDLVSAEALLLSGRAADAARLAERVHADLVRTPFDQDDAEVALLLARALLASGQEERAERVIADALRALRTTADTIRDPRLRDSFLTRVPEHRDLLTLAEQRRIGNRSSSDPS